MGRLSRFRHLEKARPDAAVDAPRPTPDGRFDRVIQTGTPEAPAAEAPAESRFSPPTATDALELDARDAGQPFSRCCRCECDHNIHARKCANCGAPLDTEEQRLFNQALWQRTIEEREAETRATAQLESERAGQQQELAKARRANAEQLARDVGDRVRSELSWGGDAPSSDTPPLVRWIGKIRDDRWRRTAWVGAIVIPALLFILPPRHSGFRQLGFVVAMIIAFGFLPPSWRRRRRRWWHWE